MKTDVGHPVQEGCRVLMNPPNGQYLPPQLIDEQKG